MPVQLDKQEMRRHAPVILACLLLAVEPALSFIGPVAGVSIFGGWNPRAMYATACIVNAVVIAALCAWFLKKLGSDRDFQARPADLFFGVLCTMCAYPAALSISETVGKYFPDGGAVSDAVIDSTSFGPVLAWILMAAAPAVSEELLFRGVLFGAFRKYGFAAALAVSAVGFSLIHGFVQQMAYTLLMGVLWALLREFSGSVVPSMLGHMAFNSVALLAVFQPTGNFAGTGSAPSLLPLFIVAIVGAAGSVWILTAMRRHAPERTNSSSFWRPAAGLAVLAMAAHFGLSYLISTL